MKTLSIVLISLAALSTSAQASHELINQPVATESPSHYDSDDLNQFLLGYPEVNVDITNGIATLTGHLESQYDAMFVVKQVEKTAGVRQVANLISYD